MYIIREKLGNSKGGSGAEGGENMAVKGAKTIAEYAIRKWLEGQNFDLNHFSFSMHGPEAILEDTNGDSLTLVYDNESRSVYVK